MLCDKQFHFNYDAMAYDDGRSILRAEEGSCYDVPLFPNYVRHKKAFEKLVSQQSEQMERQFYDVDDFDLRNIMLRVKGLRSKVESKNILTKLSTLADSGTMSGILPREDTHTNGTTKTVDVEWKIDFHSREQLYEYQQKYFRAVMDLIRENSFFRCSTSELINVRDGIENTPGQKYFYSVKRRADNIADQVKVFIARMIALAPFAGRLHSAEYPNRWFIITIIVAILVFQIVFNVSENYFDVTSQVEWPWMVFTRNPLLKGVMLDAYNMDYESYVDTQY